MFGDLFNLAVDVVTLPVQITTAIIDGLVDADLTEGIEDVKDVIKA